MISFASGQEIYDGQTGFRAFKKSILDDLNIHSRGLEFETEMTISAGIMGYKVVEIPIEYRKRIGKSKLNPLADGYRMFSAIFRSAYSRMTLISKCFAVPGALLLISSLFFMLVSVYEFLNFGQPLHPYYPLIFVFSALAGTQMITLAVATDLQIKRLTRIEAELAKQRKK